MPTARTYDRYSLDGEPFKENGRMYVYVMMPNGNKKVRWYTEAERAAQDRKAGIEPKKNDLMNFNARQAFGFGENGYITIYKGDKNLVERWAENDRTNIWYNLTFGYYTPSKFPTPEVLNGIEPIQLKWEQVKDHNDRMKPHEEVTKLVSNILELDVTQSCSTYQGQIGDRLTRNIQICDIKILRNLYGEKRSYTLIDDNGNLYSWTTTKEIMPNKKYIMSLKVKDNIVLNGQEVTVTWYNKILSEEFI